MTKLRPMRALACAALVLAVSTGCSSLSESPLTSWVRDLPVPSFAWLTGGTKKPGPMPALTATVTPRINWQQSVGAAGPGIAPAVTSSAIYAAAKDGTLTRLDTATGRSIWRISAGRPLSAGPGANDALVVVGTDKGDVLAFDTDGKPLWTARIASEVIAPPLSSRREAITSCPTNTNQRASLRRQR